MKKLIDIPDEFVHDLKIIAAKANVSVKKWLENIITNSIKKQKKL